MVVWGVPEPTPHPEALVAKGMISLATGLASPEDPRQTLGLPSPCPQPFPRPFLLVRLPPDSTLFYLVPREAPQIPTQIPRHSCTRRETLIPMALAPQRCGSCQSPGLGCSYG